MQKFENMDVIAALETIMHQNTAYYQSDFAYDIKMMREAARSDQPEDKLLLWLSRPSGTFCFRERDVLLKDTQAYNTWKFCGEQTHDRILAYAVELTGAANGTVQGNLYELDYQQHFQHIRDDALPVGANRLIYESGMREIGPKEHFDSRSDKYFGEFVRYEMQPRDPELLQAAIRQEQRSREPARPGDFKEHLIALHTGLIEAEAQRIVADMKHLAAPNSPDKNHFMVEVSPYFTKLASSRDIAVQVPAPVQRERPFRHLCAGWQKRKPGQGHLQAPHFRPQAAFRNKTGRQPEKGSGPQQATRNGGLTMNFSVEEENLICMYHTSDRRRTMARMLAALPDMDTEMRRLANGTIAQLEQMTDDDFDGQRFDFTGE